MKIVPGPDDRLDGRRRLARTRPGVAVETLEGRQLLSHIGTSPGHQEHHQAEVSTNDNSPGDGGEVRKDPRYFDIFDNKFNRPDLNVVRASVTLDGRSNVLRFEGRMQGKINTAPADASQNSLFVFGINRGSPKAIAPFLLRQGVKFDAVVTVAITNVPGGKATVTAAVVDIAAGGIRTPLSADHVKIEGRDIRVDVDAGLLPTPAGGVSVSHYTFNLWPRESTGPDSTIASFIPENAMAPIAVKGRHHGG